MMVLVFLAAWLGDDPTYAEISRKFALSAADRLVKDGKYLEAAIAYRNALLQPGEREAVRIPLALALLAKGDAAYAGIELRRAQMLYPEFARLRIDPAELFGSVAALARIADQASRISSDGDEAEVSVAIAFAWHLVGDRDRALEALGRYSQSRGEDPFVRDLKQRIERGGAPAAPPSPVPAPVPTKAPAREPVRAGEPVRATVRFLETEIHPRGEIFWK